MLLKSSVQLPSCAGASLSPAVNVSSPDGNRVSSLHSSIAASVIAPLALPSPLQGFSNISSFRFAGAIVLNLSCEASSPTCSRLAGQHLSHAWAALDPPAPRQPCRFSSPALLVCLVKKRRRSSRRRCHSSSLSCCCITCHCLALSVPRSCLLGGQILGPALGVVLAAISQRPSLGVFPIPQTSHGAADCTLTPLGLGVPDITPKGLPHLCRAKA